MHEAPEYRDRDAYSPIFVLCHAHAYSSISTAMLGSHPDLYWFPELRLFNSHTLGEALDTFGGPRDTLGDALESGGDLYEVPVGETERLRMSGMVRAVAQVHFGSQDETGIDEAWAWVRSNRAMSTAEYFDRLLEKVAPRTGIEKSPDTAASDAHLMLCIESFPRARFVHLARHPLSATESISKKMAETLVRVGRPPLPPVELHRRSARIWFTINQRIERFTASLPAPQVLRVRAEDLLTDPVPVAQRFCRWAGLDTADAAVTAMLHPETSPFSHPGPAHAPGGEHDEFLQDPTVRPIPAIDKVVIPAEWGLNRNEESGIVELAHELGYE